MYEKIKLNLFVNKTPLRWSYSLLNILKHSSFIKCNDELTIVYGLSLSWHTAMTNSVQIQKLKGQI